MVSPKASRYSRQKPFKIDDKMMMYQTETLLKGVTQWKIEALEEHQTRSKRPRAIEKGIRKKRLKPHV